MKRQRMVSFAPSPPRKRFRYMPPGQANELAEANLVAVVGRYLDGARDFPLLSWSQLIMLTMLTGILI
jgi:hypothetical protein